MTCVAFSIKFAKTNQKFAENSEFCEKIRYFSKLFTSLLRAEPYLLADVLRLGVLPEVVPRVCLLVRLLGDPHRGLQVRPAFTCTRPESSQRDLSHALLAWKASRLLETKYR